MSNYPFALISLANFAEFLYAEGVFMPHELNRVNDLWKKEQSEQAALEDGAGEKFRKSSVIGLHSEEETEWIFNKIRSFTFESNQFYHFDLRGIFEPLQLTEYKEGDFFDWHLDFGAGPNSNRKISLTVQLSDPNEYEGGDLEFQINNEIVKAPRTQGTVIIFPSFVMHRVTKIIKGKRRSIVGWVSGPSFR